VVQLLQLQTQKYSTHQNTKQADSIFRELNGCDVLL